MKRGQRAAPSVVARIHERARECPGRRALVDRERTVTYGQLSEEVTYWSNLVSAHGAREGQAVGIMVPNRATAVSALLGVAEIGAVAILFPPALPAAEASEHCRQAGTRVVLAPGDHEILEEAGGRSRAQARGLGVFQFEVPEAGGLLPGDFIGQLTSGADQPSKIAIRTLAAVLNEIDDFSEEITLTQQDAVLVLPSVAHSYGLIGGTLAPLCVGGRVLLHERLAADPPAQMVVERIRSERPTILYAVPPVYRDLAFREPTTGSAAATPADLASLRLCFSAGAPLYPEVEDRFADRFGHRICQNYGTTEIGVISLRREGTRELQASVGRPLRNRTATIVDPQRRPLGPRSIGEVVVQGPALARGYLDGSLHGGGTIEAGQLITGDLGWISEGGYVYLTGRRSQLIRIAGDTVDAAEVERAITALPGVSDAAVVGIPHPEQGARLKAVVVAEGLRATDVIEHCRRLLPHSKIPATVEFRSTLPRTAAGKILRRALLD
jgi:long-chain acyl-CoA synthetase